MPASLWRSTEKKGENHRLRFQLVSSLIYHSICLHFAFLQQSIRPLVWQCCVQVTQRLCGASTLYATHRLTNKFWLKLLAISQPPPLHLSKRCAQTFITFSVNIFVNNFFSIFQSIALLPLRFILHILSFI